MLALHLMLHDVVLACINLPLKRIVQYLRLLLLRLLILDEEERGRYCVFQEALSVQYLVLAAADRV